jgi:hypothetical protein
VDKEQPVQKCRVRGPSFPGFNPLASFSIFSCIQPCDGNDFIQNAGTYHNVRFQPPRQRPRPFAEVRSIVGVAVMAAYLHRKCAHRDRC